MGDEIAARGAEPGFTRMVEAMYMLSHCSYGLFRQNSCKKLGQQLDGLKTVFGNFTKNRSK